MNERMKQKSEEKKLIPYMHISEIPCTTRGSSDEKKFKNFTVHT